MFEVTRRIGPGLAADQVADQDRTTRFSRAQHARSVGPAGLTARPVDLLDGRQLLDVAGGTGAFTIKLCQAHPELQATIIDFPRVFDLGRPYVTDAGLDDRVPYIKGKASGPRADASVLILLVTIGIGTWTAFLHRQRVLPIDQAPAGVGSRAESPQLPGVPEAQARRQR